MRGYVKYLLLLWASICAVSCVFDADQCVMPENEDRSIMFTISLEGQMTKATWGDDYDAENSVPFDSRVIPGNLRVEVYGMDGTSLGSIRNLYYWPVNESHTEFRFMGEMPDGFAQYYNAHRQSTVYRFMVLANCDDNSTSKQNITYSHTQLDPSSEEAAIPMWGVKEADLSDLLEHTQKDIGAIWLLRAAAKIEVRLSDKLKQIGAVINAATLKYYNKTGYCLPSGAMTVSDTRKLNREACINVYRHTAVNLPMIQDKKTGNYYVYVSEYDNITYPMERNKISLSFAVGGEVKNFEDAISFCQYVGGQPQYGTDYNIVRNHIYDFEILSVARDRLTLNYQVADWQTEDWGSGEDYEYHDLMYPTYHNPVVPRQFFSAEDFSTYVISQTPQMYHHNGNDAEVGAFECFFQILAPMGVEWKPIIVASTEYYTVRAYTFPGGELLYDTGDLSKLGFLGPCSETEWFRIVVFPLSNEGAGEVEVDFGISYYQMWTDQYINLFVNGDYGNLKWPDSGDNPKIIRIKHVVEKYDK